MNSTFFVDKNGNILRVPVRLSLSPALSPALAQPRQPRGFYCPKLRIDRELPVQGHESLYAYAATTQRRSEALERLAFAALAGAGVAGVVSAFI
jgi:hypothetical protein